MPKTKTRFKVTVNVYIGDDYELTEFVTCDGYANFSRELYGSDMDGNRGVWTTFVEDEELDIIDLEEVLNDKFPDMVTYKIIEYKIDDEF